jgi:hypothetical protein
MAICIAPDEQYPDWNSALPDLLELPSDPDGWRYLDRKLVARSLNFQNKIHRSQGVIDAVYEFQGGDDLFDAIILHGCEHGLEAWAIASEMRSKYNLGQAETIFDYADFLKTRRDSVRESIDENRLHKRKCSLNSLETSANSWRRRHAARINKTSAG